MSEREPISRDLKKFARLIVKINTKKLWFCPAAGENGAQILDVNMDDALLMARKL